MKRKEYIEKAKEAAGLQYDLWLKFPGYVHMDFTLSTSQKGEEEAKYNIYTPELSHNAYIDFRDFICFMERVIKDGVVKVRINLLKEKLRKAKTAKSNAMDVICESQKELDKLV